MAGKVMLAVAGAGKTYYICHHLDSEKKNLLLTFTHENVKNINRELLRRYGYIPHKTFVMTFHSFLYQTLIRPYEATIFEAFQEELFPTKGVTLQDPPDPSVRLNNGGYRRNYAYYKVDNIRHYLNLNNEYYCSLMADLIMRVYSKNKKAWCEVLEYAASFFDTCYIDEFQDFRNKEYDLLILLAKYFSQTVMVGDYYQHSVSGRNNAGKPFKIKKSGSGLISYNYFFELLQNEDFIVDNTTLSKSYRCAKAVCKFIQQRLGITIEGNEHDGRIIILSRDTEEARTLLFSVLKDGTIPKLVYSEANKYNNIHSMNWSYSKGDTYDNICVVLTQKTESILNGSLPNNVPSITRNKLYVALTRARRDVYLVTQKDFLATLKSFNLAE